METYTKQPKSNVGSALVQAGEEVKVSHRIGCVDVNIISIPYSRIPMLVHQFCA